jgi:hypothetical protein
VQVCGGTPARHCSDVGTRCADVERSFVFVARGAPTTRGRRFRLYAQPPKRPDHRAQTGDVGFCLWHSIRVAGLYYWLRAYHVARSHLAATPRRAAALNASTRGDTQESLRVTFRGR